MYLIVKLLSITIVVILFVVVLVWPSIDTLAAGYFVTLIEKYHISPEPDRMAPPYKLIDDCRHHLHWPYFQIPV